MQYNHTSELCTNNNSSVDISSGLPSNNSSIEPSDQSSSSSSSSSSNAIIVVKIGMYQLLVPLLLNDYPSAIN